MALLEVGSLDVTIGARAVVRDLSFTIEAGELVGLTGESGSGKSLTAAAIAGLLPTAARATGSVRLDGVELATLGERALCAVRGRLVGSVFQEPASALNPLMTIGAQVAETVRVHGVARAAEAAAIARRTLARVGLDPARIAPNRYPHELSGGQRQRVALALALALTPRLLVADEPTTALDVTTQAQVLALLRELARERGMGVLLISHDLAMLAASADRLLVLREGALVAGGPCERVLDAAGDSYVGRLVRAYRLPRASAATGASGPVVLAARGLVCEYRSRREWLRPAPALRAVDGVDVEIRRGELVALVGESGSGKSTLARALLALDRPVAGDVRVDGQPFVAGREGAPRALRRAVQAVFQDPYGSLDPRHSVGRSIAEPLALLDAAPGRREAERRVAAALLAVGLDPAVAGRRPHEFSGGERQRIALARALVVEPALVVLDEAVSALDGLVRQGILALLTSLRRERGLAALLVTHDIGVAAAVSDRLLVMQGGRIVEEGPTSAVLAAPRHPHTRALAAATPTLGPAPAVA